MTTEQSLLEVQRVSRSFGKFRALNDVSLRVQAGRLCALIGPNGAGKTTFYNVISGRYRPTAGRVFFEGRDITREPVHRVVEMGLLRSFQITNIFPALTVLDNVLVPLVVHRGIGFSCFGSIAKNRALAEEAEQILARVGLTGQSHRVVSTLPYGDKRLIEIAIVLTRRPRMVLLDEPTAGMNPEETDRMIRLIKDLSEHSDTTFFITEHDMKVVFSVAERIFVLNQGELLAEGTPEEIRANPEVKKAYLGGSLDAAGL
jgi:branched-chain amino acid transport system ATP-binding protein